MWLADSFDGMPSGAYTTAFARSEAGGVALQKSKKRPSAETIVHWATTSQYGRFGRGKLNGSIASVASNFRLCWPQAFDGNWPAGVQIVRGFFADVLPGPVERLALLRADSDIFSSIHETLETLYPRLSVGGYVVFDDWCLAQAREAVLAYRDAHNITTPMLETQRHRRVFSKDLSRPFGTLNPMAFWRKSAETG